MAVAPAAARLSVIYDGSDAVAALIDQQPDGSPGLDPSVGLLQQQPAPQVLPSERQVWKVTSRAGSDATPSVAGLSAGQMAALLADRIRRSGGHLVFIDELDGDFTGADGAALAGALATLAGQPDPYSAEPGGLARRVHVYVPGVGPMLAAPSAWATAWGALTLAGGVWLEAYSGTTPWSPEQWLAWPGAFSRRFVALGGDPSRLHLVLPGGDGGASWDAAQTGDACALLADGPGAYRLGGDGAPIFVQRFRGVFGDGPAPDGPSPIACTPAPVLPPPTAAALASVLALSGSGVALGPRQLSSSRVTVGVRQSVTLALGADPLGLAADLGVSPSGFWPAAKARVTATAPGLSAGAAVSATGTATLSFVAPQPGPVTLALVVDGAPIRAALGPPADLNASLAPYPQAAAALGPALASPVSWKLTIPLGYGAPVGPVLLAAPPRPPAPAPPRVSSLRAGLAGPGVARARRLDPRRVRFALIRALDASGRPVAGARLVLRLPDGRGLRTPVDANGRLVLRLPARGGTLAGSAVGTTARLRLIVPGPARRAG